MEPLQLSILVIGSHSRPDPMRSLNQTPGNSLTRPLPQVNRATMQAVHKELANLLEWEPCTPSTWILECYENQPHIWEEFWCGSVTSGIHCKYRTQFAVY
jgi:hypothetical protein